MIENDGGKFNGPVELDADPVAPFEAATKRYVDAAMEGAGSPELDVSQEVEGVTVRGGVKAALVFWVGSDAVHGNGYYDVELASVPSPQSQ